MRPGPQKSNTWNSLNSKNAPQKTTSKTAPLKLSKITKFLNICLHFEPKWNPFCIKNRLETDFKAKVQNLTKHHYLLCSVKVSHLKKHAIWHPWVSKSSTKYQPQVRPSKIYVKQQHVSKMNPKENPNGLDFRPETLPWVTQCTHFGNPRVFTII